MGKTGPKEISERIKTKGLQKLRWYCSMCLKQCRNENEFKSHCLDEFHQRMMKKFGKDPLGEIKRYSEEFEKKFVDFLKRRYRCRRMAATVVYNNFISVQSDVEINLTRWPTLIEFVEFLGRTGKCAVEETSTGWFITYIDQDPNMVFMEERGRKRKRISTDFVEEERDIKRPFQKPAAEQMTGEILTFEQQSPNKVLRRDKSSSIKAKEQSKRNDYWLYEGLVVQVLRRDKQKAVVRRVMDNVGEIEMIGTRDVLRVYQEDLQTVIPHIGALVKVVKGTHRGSNAKLLGIDSIKHCAKVQIEKGKYRGRVLFAIDFDDICELALEELSREQDKAKEQSNRKDYFWLCEGLVVKVLDRGLFHEQKGVVRRVIGKVGEIEMIETKDVLRVEQKYLQTVIPHIGAVVKVVKGAYRGSNAKLLDINIAEYWAKVQIEGGMNHGSVLSAVEYEDICKFSCT